MHRHADAHVHESAPAYSIAQDLNLAASPSRFFAAV
jgi:hypothetical protein